MTTPPLVILATPLIAAMLYVAATHAAGLGIRLAAWSGVRSFADARRFVRLAWYCFGRYPLWRAMHSVRMVARTCRRLLYLPPLSDEAVAIKAAGQIESIRLEQWTAWSYGRGYFVRTLGHLLAISDAVGAMHIEARGDVFVAAEQVALTVRWWQLTVHVLRLDRWPKINRLAKRAFLVEVLVWTWHMRRSWTLARASVDMACSELDQRAVAELAIVGSAIRDAQPGDFTGGSLN